MSGPQPDHKSGTVDGKRVFRPLFTWRSLIASSRGPESSTTRLVLLAVSLHMNELGGSCFPSIDLLAEETALSRQAIMAHLKVAIRGGWLERREIRRVGKGWRSWQYFAQWPSLPQGGQSRLPPNYPQGGQPGSDRGQRHIADMVNDVDPSTSLTLQGGREVAPTHRRAHTKKSILPDTWAPSKEVWDWIRQRNITDNDAKALLEAFTFHARAKARQEADWDAALQLWITRERKIAYRGQQPVQLTPSVHRADTSCCWTDGDREPRCNAPGDVAYGHGRYLCSRHAAEYSKRLEACKPEPARTHAN